MQVKNRVYELIQHGAYVSMEALDYIGIYNYVKYGRDGPDYRVREVKGVTLYGWIDPRTYKGPTLELNRMWMGHFESYTHRVKASNGNQILFRVCTLDDLRYHPTHLVSPMVGLD
jgi:hypothetical protein